MLLVRVVAVVWITNVAGAVLGARDGHADDVRRSDHFTQAVAAAV